MKEKPGKKSGIESKAELRQRAEKEQQSRMHGREELASADKDNLVHELEVHQIELEMQNDELRQAHQEAQESRNRYLDLFDFAPVGYFVLDHHFLILEANLTGSRMLGVERDKLIGQRFSRFLVPAFQDAFHHLMLSASTVIEQPLELQIQKTSGEMFYAELRVVPLKTPGENARYRVAMTDVTQRKQAEEALLLRTGELETSKNALEVSLRELESFSYSVSHDLRAPLRSMDGFSQALLEDYADKLDATGKQYLKYIRSSSQMMAKLIGDLLTISRIARATMDITSVDLSSLAMEVSAESAKSQTARQVEFSIAPGLEDVGDRNLLKLVLQALIENACKFTGKTEHPKIEFGAEEKDGKRIYFVRDNGVGFDMAYVGKLFKPFQRLHSGKEFAGTGIGLALVQRIISRHGGKVRAEGEPGKGATFYFSLKS